MHEQHTCGVVARSESRSAAEDLRDLIGLSARLARQGCGEAVIELALSRKGAQPDTPRRKVRVQGPHHPPPRQRSVPPACAQPAPWNGCSRKCCPC